MSLPLSKLPPGVLNSQIREKVYEGFDIQKDNFMKVFRRVVAAQFGEHYTLVNREFTGVCMEILSDKEKQSLVTKGAFDKIANTSASNLEKKVACRVYIPEIHTDRALPDDIYNPSEKDKEKMKAFFPIFVSANEEIASMPLRPGHLLQVKITQNNGGGTFLYLINGSNSRINIFNQNKASNEAFKCNIFRFSKIINSQGRSISFGEVITEEKQESGAKLDEASLKQQYKKYLSEKETFFYKQLREYWIIPRLKKLVNDVGTSFNLNLLSKKLIWLLMQKLSAYSITGITNAGLTVLNVDSIDDSYGIFKSTKEQFDSLKLNYINEDITLLAVDTDYYKPSADDFFSNENGFLHSDLIDPYVSTYFFVLDFLNYIDNLDSTISIVSAGLSQSKNQKLVTNYFTKNDKKIKFIFSNDYGNIMNDFDNTPASSTESIKDKRPKIKENFLPFTSWITAAAGGTGVNIEDFIKNETKKPDNSQVLEAGKPKDTKDECHSNYPQKNSYLEHVDAQKASMRRYIESSASGPELDFLSNMHEGVNNIIMSGSPVSSPFKIVRFDGNSGYKQDSTRWFNPNNPVNLISNKNYRKSFYRPQELISKITLSSMNLGNESSSFYKRNLKLIYDLGSPMPHFLITPEGQIIQLVDISCAVENKLSSKKSSINIAFSEGIGTINHISGENNVVLDNYILVKTNPAENVYRPHKIGTKAALEAADKLINFLMSKVGIKYNLAAQDFKLGKQDINKSTIQAHGHYKGVSGMNYIYYAWTYGLAYKNGGKNILSKQYGYN